MFCSAADKQKHRLDIPLAPGNLPNNMHIEFHRLKYEDHLANWRFDHVEPQDEHFHSGE